VLRDDTDAELVLRAWEQWSERSPQRLLGDFVYFVWDARIRQLFGARDTAGARHFYYQHGDGWFAFASEMKALQSLGLVQSTLNPNRVFDYVTSVYDRIDDSETFCRHTLRLPLAHAMTVSQSGIRSWRYWHPEQLPMQQYASMQECQQAFVDVFKDAIRCRLRSSGSVGCMLSGGLDSSSIVAMIGKYLRDELTQPLLTFSLVNANRAECIEWPYIKAMIDDGQWENIAIDCAFTDSQCRRLLDSIPSLDQPYALSEALSSIPLTEAAQARNCRVMLEGMASDLFYHSPQDSVEQVFRHGKWSWLPAVLAAHHRHGMQGAPALVLRKLVRALLPERVRQFYRQRHDSLTSDEAGLLQLLPADIASGYVSNRQAIRQSRETGCFNGHASEQLIADMLGPMQAFAYEEEEPLYGAAHAELRGPYADRRVMEFMFAMPLQARMSLGWFKSFLRDSMTGILPDFVRLRRERGGHPGWQLYRSIARFTARHEPDLWFQPEKDALFDGLVDRAALRRLYELEQRSGPEWKTPELFGLVVLHRWLHTNSMFNSGIHRGVQ
jgi:asparagine synthase (glutamine-hydrolysing)